MCTTVLAVRESLTAFVLCLRDREPDRAVTALRIVLAVEPDHDLDGEKRGHG
jgi:hypothetical protein